MRVNGVDQRRVLALTLVDDEIELRADVRVDADQAEHAEVRDLDGDLAVHVDEAVNVDVELHVRRRQAEVRAVAELDEQGALDEELRAQDLDVLEQGSNSMISPPLAKSLRLTNPLPKTSTPGMSKEGALAGAW